MSHTTDHNRSNEPNAAQRNTAQDSNNHSSYEETPRDEASFEDADRETHDPTDSSRPGDIPFDQAVTEYENPELADRDVG